jgi:alkylhydroperoxidase family enzyme
MQAKIFAWPEQVDGLTDRQRALLDATDQFVNDRTISDETWRRLSSQLDRRQLIEFSMLAGHYDALAATIATLKIPLDHPIQ